ncbi:hypothetical protein [Actinomadura macra]|uniref:hypothetical protein n=1 Tax=Actinomadura macra TaxID=46164 RepID=UPI000835D2D4|nr:hypothetical protein [Actinomadura macra]
MAVYMKSTIGVLLVFSGVVSSPGKTPTMQVARVFLEITGIGFGLYCVAAFGLFLAGVRMRAMADARPAATRDWP